MAARVFVNRFSPRCYGLAVQLLGDRAVAEDVAQEALLRAWRHAASFDARKGTVATWLLSIVRHLAIDTLRMRRMDPFDPDRLQPLLTSLSVDDPARAAEHDDDAGRLRTALAGLPPDQRRAVVLAAYGGLSAAEVAAADRIPLGTAKTRIRAGLRRLRVAYTDDRASEEGAS